MRSSGSSRPPSNSIGRSDIPAGGTTTVFSGSLKIGLNGLIGFSTALLSLSTLVGFASAFGAFVFAVAYGIVQLAGNKFPVGNPTIVVLILLIGGMQLICLGIMGQYIGRIYEETKRRPRFVVDRAAGFDSIKGNPVRPIKSGERARSGRAE